MRKPRVFGLRMLAAKNSTNRRRARSPNRSITGGNTNCPQASSSCELARRLRLISIIDGRAFACSKLRCRVRIGKPAIQNGYQFRARQTGRSLNQIDGARWSALTPVVRDQGLTVLGQ